MASYVKLEPSGVTHSTQWRSDTLNALTYTLPSGVTHSTQWRSDTLNALTS
jgi:hypothetical protein